jgi:hypothetical protein
VRFRAAMFGTSALGLRRKMSCTAYGIAQAITTPVHAPNRSQIVCSKVTAAITTLVEKKRSAPAQTARGANAGRQVHRAIRYSKVRATKCRKRSYKPQGTITGGERVSVPRECGNSPRSLRRLCKFSPKRNRNRDAIRVDAGGGKRKLQT